jgi:hypothetical protein
VFPPAASVPSSPSLVPELDIPRRSRPDMQAVRPSPSTPDLAPPSRPSGAHAAARPSGANFAVARPSNPGAMPSSPSSPELSSFDSDPPPSGSLQLDVDHRSGMMGGGAAAWKRAELHGNKTRAPSASASARDEGPSVIGLVAAVAIQVVLAAGALGALLRFAHRASGITLKNVFPAAVDGTSALSAGAVALSAVALTVAIGALGVRAPRSIALIFSAIGALLVAIVMIVVTFSTTPTDPPTPPESAIILPFVMPVMPLGFAIWAITLGVRQWKEGGARRALVLPAGVAAGAIAFFAFEVSPAVSLLVLPR